MKQNNIVLIFQAVLLMGVTILKCINLKRTKPRIDNGQNLSCLKGGSRKSANVVELLLDQISMHHESNHRQQEFVMVFYAYIGTTCQKHVSFDLTDPKEDHYNSLCPPQSFCSSGSYLKPKSILKMAQVPLPVSQEPKKTQTGSITLKKYYELLFLLEKLDTHKVRPSIGLACAWQTFINHFQNSPKLYLEALHYYETELVYGILRLLRCWGAEISAYKREFGQDEKGRVKNYVILDIYMIIHGTRRQTQEDLDADIVNACYSLLNLPETDSLPVLDTPAYIQSKGYKILAEEAIRAIEKLKKDTELSEPMHETIEDVEPLGNSVLNRMHQAYVELFRFQSIVFEAASDIRSAAYARVKLCAQLGEEMRKYNELHSTHLQLLQRAQLEDYVQNVTDELKLVKRRMTGEDKRIVKDAFYLLRGNRWF